MNACRKVCGPMGLSTPARRATRRTRRPATWRSKRLPSGPTKIGPESRSPMARSTALAVRRASGTVTTLPPLRSTVRVRCPRSSPRASMSAPIASDTGALEREERDEGVLGWCTEPAATRRAPTSLR